MKGGAFGRLRSTGRSALGLGVLAQLISSGSNFSYQVALLHLLEPEDSRVLLLSLMLIVSVLSFARATVSEPLLAHRRWGIQAPQVKHCLAAILCGSGAALAIAPHPSVVVAVMVSTTGLLTFDLVRTRCLVQGELEQLVRLEVLWALSLGVGVLLAHWSRDPGLFVALFGLSALVPVVAVLMGFAWSPASLVPADHLPAPKVSYGLEYACERFATLAALIIIGWSASAADLVMARTALLCMGMAQVVGAGLYPLLLGRASQARAHGDVALFERVIRLAFVVPLAALLALVVLHGLLPDSWLTSAYGVPEWNDAVLLFAAVAQAAWFASAAGRLRLRAMLRDRLSLRLRLGNGLLILAGPAIGLRFLTDGSAGMALLAAGSTVGAVLVACGAMSPDERRPRSPADRPPLEPSCKTAA